MNFETASMAMARHPIGMDRSHAVAVLERLHAAQNAMYAGGDLGPLRELLCEDVVWTVPGENAIAGEHRGIEAVLAYFARRRELAAGSLQLHPGDVLVGEGDRVAALVDGAAEIDGVQRRWATVGLYRLRGERIAECRLLAFDQAVFDAVWRG
jgi:ketosteroid isomerase-like protein